MNAPRRSRARSERRDAFTTDVLGDRLHDLVTLAQCTETERSVLGACLFDITVWHAIDGRVTPDDFGEPKHALVFEVIRSLVESGRAVDLNTVTEGLGPRLQAIGGPQYLHEMMDGASTGAYIESWVEVLVQTSAKRRIQRGAINVLIRAADAPYDDVVASVSTLHETASNSTSSEDLEPMSDLVPLVFERIESSTVRGGVLGRSTGLRDLTTALGGLSGGQSIIIGARTGVGKTSAAIGIADAIATEAVTRGEKGVVLFFSLEMPKVEIAQRQTAQRSQVSETRIRQASLTQQDLNDLTIAAESVVKLPVFVADRTTSIEGIRAACHRARLKYGKVLAVFIDYLQLIDWNGASESDSREQRLAAVSKRIKRLAVELDCPIITLAQLSRKCEEGPNKRPMLMHLRESGAIEQDADVVVFLYRDEIYNRNTEDKGIAEFIIAKQRHGATGTVRTRFLSPITRFADLPSAEDGLRDFDGAQSAMPAGDGDTTGDNPADDAPPPFNE